MVFNGSAFVKHFFNLIFMPSPITFAAPMKDVQVAVRMTAEEKQAIATLAKRYRLKPAQAVRGVMVLICRALMPHQPGVSARAVLDGAYSILTDCRESAALSEPSKVENIGTSSQKGIDLDYEDIVNLSSQSRENILSSSRNVVKEGGETEPSHVKSRKPQRKRR